MKTCPESIGGACVDIVEAVVALGHGATGVSQKNPVPGMVFRRHSNSGLPELSRSPLVYAHSTSVSISAQSGSSTPRPPAPTQAQGLPSAQVALRRPSVNASILAPESTPASNVAEPKTAAAAGYGYAVRPSRSLDDRRHACRPDGPSGRRSMQYDGSVSGSSSAAGSVVGRFDWSTLDKPAGTQAAVRGLAPHECPRSQAAGERTPLSLSPPESPGRCPERSFSALYEASRALQPGVSRWSSASYLPLTPRRTPAELASAEAPPVGVPAGVPITRSRSMPQPSAALSTSPPEFVLAGLGFAGDAPTTPAGERRGRLRSSSDTSNAAVVPGSGVPPLLRSRSVSQTPPQLNGWATRLAPLSGAAAHADPAAGAGAVGGYGRPAASRRGSIEPLSLVAMDFCTGNAGSAGRKKPPLSTIGGPAGLGSACVAEQLATPRAAAVDGAASPPALRDAWNIERSELQLADELGRGAFGVVYLARWRGSQCVVKQAAHEAHAHEFLAEADRMKRLRPHPNVVLMLGVCGRPVCIVTEWVDGGSLHAIVIQGRRILDTAALLSILTDVACGMVHIHQEGILHADLAARNVLLSQRGPTWLAKISDFGLSHSATGDCYEGVQRSMLPVRWTAPEVLLDARRFSKAADVWSFGVTCWEVLQEDVPYRALSHAELVDAVCHRGHRLERPDGRTHPDELWQLMQQCWWAPADRPPFHRVHATMLVLLCALQPTTTAGACERNAGDHVSSHDEVTSAEYAFSP
eukprot:TRINITY_DN1841_c1_g1_i3.p1 TRINITY_DN1841_c1_g1~~TRINITY_DN1841_c1_g1_i3.p1  ORF type:complete len:751 (-),score=186.03 TRINITY_DN1841_c1_g1_i3:293-2545(-)